MQNSSTTTISCVCVSVRADGNGSVFPGSDGGRAMQLDGKIVLCDNSYANQTRNYNGALSHLSIYNSALTYTQILALFHQVGFFALAAQFLCCLASVLLVLHT